MSVSLKKKCLSKSKILISLVHNQMLLLLLHIVHIHFLCLIYNEFLKNFW